MTTTPEAGMRLAPCPFCGGPARLMDMTKRATKLGYQYVECKACGVDVGSVSAWNTRAAAPVPPAGGEGFVKVRRALAGEAKWGGTADEIRSLLSAYDALAARAQPPAREVVGYYEGKGGPLWTEGKGWVHLTLYPRASDLDVPVALYAHPAEPAARGLGSSAAPIPGGALADIADSLKRIADTLDGTAAGVCITETIFGGRRPQ